jgi:hypothetical protein
MKWQLLILVAACAKEPPTDTTKPAVELPAPRPPAPPARAVLPSLTDLTAIDLEQQQGGPSSVICDRIQYSMHFDLAAGTWSSGLCKTDAMGNAGPHDPLAPKHGTLTQAQRDALAAAFGKLAVSRGGSCGNDGGSLTLTLHAKAGTTTTFVDENWGCKKPPPAIATGLKDFANAVAPIALY